MTKHLDHLKKPEDEGFTFICLLGDLQERVGKKFIVSDIEIAVFKLNSEIFAVSNICPHQQTHLIFDGFIEDEFVVCPAHGWKFNLRTGRKDSGSNGLRTFPIELIDDKVFVKVTQKELKW
ncbi:MAG: Rieske (2Fe-2S) protein [Ignavibacteriaceae bacterium]|nr:Rieske (2Fe-2S) protein [Ignavibacteriaceae bacterium]